MAVSACGAIEEEEEEEGEEVRSGIESMLAGAGVGV